MTSTDVRFRQGPVPGHEHEAWTAEILSAVNLASKVRETC